MVTVTNANSDDWTFQTRPWGWMVKLIHRPTFWLKLIWVSTRNSLQSHEKRREIHIKFEWALKPWSVKKIPVREVHRMTRGLYLEIALGEPREDDIKRYEDDFGRAPQV